MIKEKLDLYSLYEVSEKINSFLDSFDVIKVKIEERRIKYRLAYRLKITYRGKLKCSN